jgi:hypothetical protein
MPERKLPLPLWEGVGGRGYELKLFVFFTPTLTLPHEGGWKMETFRSSTN